MQNFLYFVLGEQVVEIIYYFGTTPVVDHRKKSLRMAGFKQRFQTVLQNLKAVFKIVFLVRYINRYHNLVGVRSDGQWFVFIGVMT
ncbi:MAG: hypothetical protein CVU07_13720 [Bacteroidetes bacterium HGW-Bacteroidetes-23]|nr:MAG: hypothetical protein CVU07_13720 [Bacteroidetes bacterium HGW-Bacteroidetes-23]